LKNKVQILEFGTCLGNHRDKGKAYHLKLLTQ
jgi:hypothetical protein